ncbi:hypothetical protein BKA62DRAFT_720472 [Auriculariales sp. MPI-PUGE-AT-0066]|nr:hypothetical protein BKA62DRAFT_720472 [Auriculariales sp. MPI-PUGE-AT-0066]
MVMVACRRRRMRWLHWLFGASAARHGADESQRPSLPDSTSHLYRAAVAGWWHAHTMSFIPLDIAYLWQDDSLSTFDGMLARRTWLAEALLVARTWYLAGLPVLYHRIEVGTTTERVLTLLLRTLKARPGLTQLIKDLRPYDRDPEVQLRFTADGVFSRQLRSQRQHKKLLLLLRLCDHTTVLRVNVADLAAYKPSLKFMSQLRRLDVMLVGNYLTALPSFALDRLRKDVELRLVDFKRVSHRLSTRCLQLTSLEIGRLASSEIDFADLHDASQFIAMLYPFRETLRVLHCLQLNRYDGSPSPAYEWLMPVTAGLTALKIFIDCDTPLGDYSCMTALKSFTVQFVPTPRSQSHSGTLIQASHFPPSIEVMSCESSPGVNPLVTAAAVRDTMFAFDTGFLPALATIHVHAVVLDPSTLYRDWAVVALLSRNIVERRGLSFDIDISMDMNVTRARDRLDVYERRMAEKRAAGREMHREHAIQRRKVTMRISAYAVLPIVLAAYLVCKQVSPFVSLRGVRAVFASALLGAIVPTPSS